MLRRERLYHSMSSVRQCVTFRYRYHIGWNSSKVISPPNSLGPVWGLTPTWAIWCNGNTPKIVVEYGWGHSGAKKTALYPKRCNIGPMLLLRTNEKSYTRFWLVPKSTALDALERCTQGLPKVFNYSLLSQKRAKLQTSHLAVTFTGSIWTEDH